MYHERVVRKAAVAGCRIISKEFQPNIQQQRKGSYTAKMEEQRHLKQGSVHPPLLANSVRLYNMRFCPFAQRSLLVAETKQIKYDIVNLDLKKKADWFLKLNSKGQVPILEFEDGTSIAESLIISDYLDEQYPGNRSLYPNDPLRKAKERLLIDRFKDVIYHNLKLWVAFGKTDGDRTTPYNLMLQNLEVYEKEIQARNTPFFGGYAPGMLDYMIWPWFERNEVLIDLGGKNFDIFDGRFSHLKKWCTSMRNDPAVKVWLIDTSAHRHFIKSYLAGNPDYDFLIK